jgi:hypothetical protein
MVHLNLGFETGARCLLKNMRNSSSGHAVFDKEADGVSGVDGCCTAIYRSSPSEASLVLRALEMTLVVTLIPTPPGDSNCISTTIRLCRGNCSARPAAVTPKLMVTFPPGLLTERIDWRWCLGASNDCPRQVFI